MPSGRKTPVVRIPTADADGYIRGNSYKEFDPLEWPFCVDYKFRDEAHAERHQECMSMALSEWEEWKPVLAAQAAEYPLLIQIIAKVASSLTPKPGTGKTHAADMANLMARMLTFSLDLHTWIKLRDYSQDSSEFREVSAALRRVDARWGLVKISIFDIVEEGFLFEAEILLRQAICWAFHNTYNLRTPVWSMECDNEDYREKFFRAEDGARRNDWGVPVDEEDWQWWR